MSKNRTSGNPSAQILEGLQSWEAHPDRFEAWLDGHLLAGDLSWTDLAPRLRDIFRHWYQMEALIKKHCRKAPKRKLKHVLHMFGTELLTRPAEKTPKIIHFAGEVAKQCGFSAPERRFVNGSLRAIAPDLDLYRKESEKDSHPDWLYQRWVADFGPDNAQSLAIWNQQAPESFCYSDEDVGLPTQWPHFYQWKEADRGEVLQEIREGKAYIQDPFTRWPIELLGVEPGHRVLDLCSAPGGKSWHLLRQLKGKGTLVTVDRSESRLTRLRENLGNLPYKNFEIDHYALGDTEIPLPTWAQEDYDRVMLDVPCSNTGVIRRRPDVKIHLTLKQIHELTKRQSAMLGWASQRVAPGGRLVYSTCSLEKEENEKVAEEFLVNRPDFKEISRKLSFPWADMHDGGAAFCFERKRSIS